MLIINSAKDLALAIASKRKKLQLSQKETGKLVGLKQQTVSDFENNPEGTKLATLFQILSAVELNILILDKDETDIVKQQWKEEW